MKLVLEKIISGGQTGADQAGLQAAVSLGLKTGGTAPPGFKTDIGPLPNLGTIYGLVEGRPDPHTYPRRTRQNVKDSDGTVWFGYVNSPGGRVTKSAARTYAKPFLVNPTPSDLLEWLIEKQIRVLNVAGNRERTNPGICLVARTLLVVALRGRLSDKEVPG